MQRDPFGDLWGLLICYISTDLDYPLFTMPKIITTTQLQKTIGQLLSYVSNSWVIVTNKGKPAMILLPYFDGNEHAIANYLEDYEMHQNAPALRRKFQESLDSGISDFVI